MKCFGPPDAEKVRSLGDKEKRKSGCGLQVVAEASSPALKCRGKGGPALWLEEEGRGRPQ